MPLQSEGVIGILGLARLQHELDVELEHAPRLLQLASDFQQTAEVAQHALRLVRERRRPPKNVDCVARERLRQCRELRCAVRKADHGRVVLSRTGEGRRLAQQPLAAPQRLGHLAAPHDARCPRRRAPGQHVRLGCLLARAGITRLECCHVKVEHALSLAGAKVGRPVDRQRVVCSEDTQGKRIVASVRAHGGGAREGERDPAEDLALRLKVRDRRFRGIPARNEVCRHHERRHTQALRHGDSVEVQLHGAVCVRPRAHLVAHALQNARTNPLRDGRVAVDNSKVRLAVPCKGIEDVERPVKITQRHERVRRRQRDGRLVLARRGAALRLEHLECLPDIGSMLLIDDPAPHAVRRPGVWSRAVGPVEIAVGKVCGWLRLHMDVRGRRARS